MAIYDFLSERLKYCYILMILSQHKGKEVESEITMIKSPL